MPLAKRVQERLNDVGVHTEEGPEWRRISLSLKGYGLALNFLLDHAAPHIRLSNSTLRALAEYSQAKQLRSVYAKRTFLPHSRGVSPALLVYLGGTPPKKLQIHGPYDARLDEVGRFGLDGGLFRSDRATIVELTLSPQEKQELQGDQVLRVDFTF